MKYYLIRVTQPIKFKIMKISFWKFYKKNYLPVTIFMLGLGFLSALMGEYLASLLFGVIVFCILLFSVLGYYDKLQ